WGHRSDRSGKASICASPIAVQQREMAEPHVRLGKIWSEGDRLLQRGPGILIAAQQLIHVPEVVVERREVGLERDCSLEARCCLREASFSQVAHSELVMAPVVARRETDRFQSHGNRFGEMKLGAKEG